MRLNMKVIYINIMSFFNFLIKYINYFNFEINLKVDLKNN